MKYFFKQYWRYIAMALAFATLNFFLNSCHVKALTIDDFDQLENFQMSENPWNTESEDFLTPSTGVQTITKSWNNLQIGVGNTQYVVIPVYSAYYLTIDRTCVYGVSGSVGTLSGGGCTLTSNEYFNWRVYITDENNNGHYCNYNGVYAICNVKNINTITSVNANFFYTYYAISIGGVSGNNANIGIKVAFYFNNYWYRANSSQQEQQAQEIIEEIQKENENQKVCEIIDKNKIKDDNVALNQNGTIWDTNVWGVTDFIKISGSTKIKQIANYDSNTNAYMCIYNTNKVKISCTNVRVIPTEITIPENANYIRFSIRKDSNLPQFEICKNGNQATNDMLDDINDSITDSNTSGGQSQANDFFNNFDSGETGSLMDIVSLPLDFLDSLNNTCSPISITLPFFNQSFQLPCLRSTLTNAFGGVVSIIILVINALLCYRLIKGFIDIIHNLKDPNNDEIEVMDL